MSQPGLFRHPPYPQHAVPDPLLLSSYPVEQQGSFVLDAVLFRTTSASFALDAVITKWSFVRQATNGNTGSQTTITVTITTPTAGNLLVTAIGSDKTAGTYTIPTGFAVINQDITADVSGAMAWKVADGSETSVIWSQTTASPAGLSAWVGEYLPPSGTIVVDASAETVNDGGSVQSRSSGTTAATVDAHELAVAMVAADTWGSVDLTQAWTNGFIQKAFVGSGAGPPACGVAQAYLFATGAVETTFSTTDTGDQMYAQVATFTVTAAAVEGSFTLNAAIAVPTFVDTFTSDATTSWYSDDGHLGGRSAGSPRKTGGAYSGSDINGAVMRGAPRHEGGGTLQFDAFIPAGTPANEVSVQVQTKYRDIHISYSDGDGDWILVTSNPSQFTALDPYLSGTNEWYRVKFNFAGTEAGTPSYWKIWKVGDAEPDWLVTFTSDASATDRVASYLTTDEASLGIKLDNIRYWSSLSAFSLDGGFTLDATIMPKATLDAVIMPSFTLDAILRREQTATFALDAITKREQTASFTLDALIVEPIWVDTFTRSVLGSPDIGAIYELIDGTPALDGSELTKSPALLTIEGGRGALVGSVQFDFKWGGGSFTAFVRAGNIGVGLGITGSSFAFAVDQDTVSFEFSPENGVWWTVKSWVDEFNGNGQKVKVWRRQDPEPDWQAEGVGFDVGTAPGQLTWNSPAGAIDNILVRMAEGPAWTKATFTLDAVILRTQSASFVLDAVLFKTTSASFTLDAIALRTESASFALDAAIATLFFEDDFERSVPQYEGLGGRWMYDFTTGTTDLV